MHSGTLGKVGNCQIGVSVHAVTDAASVAINWALFVPESWDDTTTTDADAVAQIRRRRARCKIPDDVRHREKWRLALDMLDQVTGPPAQRGAEGGVGGGGWGLPARVTVADAGYGDITGFRLGLQQRGLPYVVAVKGTTSAYPVDAVPTAPAYSGRGRPPKPGYRDGPSNLTARPGRRPQRGRAHHLASRLPPHSRQSDRRSALAFPGYSGTAGHREAPSSPGHPGTSCAGTAGSYGKNWTYTDQPGRPPISHVIAGRVERMAREIPLGLPPDPPQWD
jgi:hypothetical protein